MQSAIFTRRVLHIQDIRLEPGPRGGADVAGGSTDLLSQPQRLELNYTCSRCKCRTRVVKEISNHRVLDSVDQLIAS